METVGARDKTATRRKRVRSFKEALLVFFFFLSSPLLLRD